MKNTDQTHNNEENINTSAEITENTAEVISDEEAAPVLSKEDEKRKQRAVKKAIKESDKDAEPFNLKKEIWEWTYTIVIALAVAFLLKTFVFDIVKVDGNSMFPTLHDKDRLVVTKLGYTPKQGDIIILDSTYKKREEYKDEYEQAKGKKLSLTDKISFKTSLPKRLRPVYYVKRVIALPGQTVDIKNGNVYVDGQVLEESYAEGTTKLIDTSMPITVDDDCVFVMGDNREHSTDSRAQTLGQVPYDAVLGKSQFRLFPFSDIGPTK